MHLLDALLHEIAEKRLRNGVAPAVSSPAHTGLKIVGETDPPPIITTVLTALLRVIIRIL